MGQEGDWHPSLAPSPLAVRSPWQVWPGLWDSLLWDQLGTTQGGGCLTSQKVPGKGGGAFLQGCWGRRI